ncbi:MAG: hypothetical protein J6Z79_05055 [Clostridia bacterium]|nr:hypothetical protein [Clostridia bacterium]
MKINQIRSAALAILIAALMVFSALSMSGCSGAAPEQKKATVTKEVSDPGNPETRLPFTEPAVTDETNAVSFWKNIPDQFVFSSGAGGWATEIKIADDGSFTGRYHDSELGEAGDGYPKGTVYICEFSGRFTEPEQVSETIYTTFLKEIKQEKEKGEEWVENGTKYIAADPYGFDDADLFYIYLPGTPANQIAEAFFPWAMLDPTSLTALPDDMYGIYNLNGAMGFINY